MKSNYKNEFIDFVFVLTHFRFRVNEEYIGFKIMSFIFIYVICTFSGKNSGSKVKIRNGYTSFFVCRPSYI